MYRVTLYRSTDCISLSHCFRARKDAAACASMLWAAATGEQVLTSDVNWWNKWRSTTAKSWQNSLQTVAVDMVKV